MVSTTMSRPARVVEIRLDASFHNHVPGDHHAQHCANCDESRNVVRAHFVSSRRGAKEEGDRHEGNGECAGEHPHDRRPGGPSHLGVMMKEGRVA
jgi:hypothetical protein